MLSSLTILVRKMSKEPKQLLIDGLWEHLNRINSTREMKHLEYFYTCLKTAEGICENEHNPYFKSELARVSLHFYVLNMQCQKSYFVPLDAIERLHKLISTREILELVINDSQCASVMAFMYTHALAEASECDDPYHMDDVNNMLKLWIGITPAPNTFPDFAATIASIHGPGTYELFRPDVKEDSDLPKYLFRNNIPVLGTNFNSSKLHTAPSIELPTDLG